MQFGNLVSNAIPSSHISAVQQFDLNCYGVVGVCSWYSELLPRLHCCSVKTLLITIRLELVRKTRSKTFPIINKVL